MHAVRRDRWPVCIADVRRGVAVDLHGEIVRLAYGPGATIRRLNKGLRRRANRTQFGFKIDPVSGYWAKNEDEAEEALLVGREHRHQMLGDLEADRVDDDHRALDVADRAERDVRPERAEGATQYWREIVGSGVTIRTARFPWRVEGDC